jgi:hypothetical protein
VKIKIEDGKPTVELRKGEVTALNTAAEVCNQLSSWLDNEDAKQAFNSLTIVIKTYAPKSVEVPDGN